MNLDLPQMNLAAPAQTQGPTVPKHAPGDTVYYEEDEGIVVWVDPKRCWYKVLWVDLLKYGWNEADSCYAAWYSEGCLHSTPPDPTATSDF